MIDHMIIILYEYTYVTPSEVQVLVSWVLHTHARARINICMYIVMFIIRKLNMIQKNKHVCI